MHASAAVLAGHGLLLWFADALQPVLPRLPEAAGLAFFWALAGPALVLTRPFVPLFWKLGLMNAPGWFAWPKASAMALAYGCWIVVLLTLAQLALRVGRR